MRRREGVPCLALYLFKAWCTGCTVGATHSSCDVPCAAGMSEVVARLIEQAGKEGLDTPARLRLNTEFATDGFPQTWEEVRTMEYSQWARFPKAHALLVRVAIGTVLHSGRDTSTSSAQLSHGLWWHAHVCCCSLTLNCNSR